MAARYDYIYITSACKHLKNLGTHKKAQIKRYHTGEMDVHIPHDLTHAKVLLISSMGGSLSSANDHLVETMLTLKALRPAQHITLYLVYAAYTRHDDKGAWMYSLLSLADDIIILEPHTPPPEPIQANSMNTVFAHDIKARFESRPLIISPDQGGKNRASQLASLLNTDYVALTKKRNNNTITMTEHGSDTFFKDRVCIVIDDIVDSGSTLLAAHHYLHKNQAKNIHAYVTHALTDISTAHKLYKYYDSITITNSMNQSFFNKSARVLGVLSSLGQSQFERGLAGVTNTPELDILIP